MTNHSSQNKMHGDRFATQIDAGFAADPLEAEGVVLLDGADRLGVEEFVGVLKKREKADASQVDAATFDGFHAERRVLGRVLLVFDPLGELPIEFIEGGEVEVADEELVADGAENLSIFPFAACRGQPWRRVGIGRSLQRGP